MSEPVSNVEIEDVLSSIRRLVSNTGREETDASEEDVQDTDKLVLTPSLRVDDDVAEASDEVIENNEVIAQEPGATDALSAVDFVFTEEKPADEELHVDIAEYHADDSVEPQETGDEPQAAFEDSGAHDLQPEDCETAQGTTLETDGFDAETMRENTENAEQSDPEDPWNKIPEDQASEDQSAQDVPDAWHDLQAHAASFEKVVAARDDQWDPDGIADDENAASQIEPLPWVDHDEVDGEEPAQQTKDETHPRHPLESAMLRFRHQEPAASEEAADAAPEEQSGDTLGNEFLTKDTAISPEEALLDEDALRDLVSEIVRQELQGALGERITRNVRKLVRREIHRALTAQEFD